MEIACIGNLEGGETCDKMTIVDVGGRKKGRQRSWETDKKGEIEHDNSKKRGRSKGPEQDQYSTLNICARDDKRHQPTRRAGRPW